MNQGDYEIQAAVQRTTIERLKAELAQRTGVTADGVSYGRGSKVFYRDPTGYVQGLDVGLRFRTDSSVPEIVYSPYPVFSTREAAEAAEGKQQAVIERLRAKLEERKDDIHAQGSTIERLTQERDYFSRAYSECQNAYAKLGGEIERLSAQLGELRSELALANVCCANATVSEQRLEYCSACGHRSRKTERGQ